MPAGRMYAEGRRPDVFRFCVAFAWDRLRVASIDTSQSQGVTSGMGDQGASPNGRKLPEAPLVAIGAVVLVAAIAAESRGSSRRQLHGRRC